VDEEGVGNVRDARRRELGDLAADMALDGRGNERNVDRSRDGVNAARRLGGGSDQLRGHAGRRGKESAEHYQCGIEDCFDEVMITDKFELVVWKCLNAWRGDVAHVRQGRLLKRAFRDKRKKNGKRFKNR